ncbi:alpha/beta hydrolase [Halotalea alkalilenta]|uniref:alpha/beta hydrolase n=1 Tax=Halotalea alkalilenta TaxID=376489 RepID=UPI000694B8F0|nr:alpha/beta hydrolase-fold protein [Halotalea alkalilenta]
MSAHHLLHLSPGRAAASLAAGLAFAFTSLAVAQPSMQPLGPNIADVGSDAYSFKRFEIDSDDGQRHYRIWVGRPEAPPPPGGYPVLYMLDGNAAIGALDEELLGAIDRAAPPVLVAIGYQTELPFDTTARAYDYTPPDPDGKPGTDPWNQTRESGGSDTFRALLHQRIIPEAEQDIAIDASRRALWGHSYAGLFVLDTLFQAPGDFSRYYAASPSLGWNGGQSLAREGGLARRLTSETKSLTLFHGGDEVGRHQRNADRPPSEEAEPLRDGSRLRARLSPTVVEDLAKRLDAVEGLEVRYRAYPALSHGPMLAASLHDALRDVAGLPMSDPQEAQPPRL